MATVREVAVILSGAGIPSAQHDARVLVRHACAHALAIDELVAARAARVPLQHLIGTAGFRYLDLAVGPGVFVPRPETELLVDAALGALDARAPGVPAGNDLPLVVDLCAGSGAIGLSIASEHPRAVVHLVERSEPAFEWLRRNAAGRDRVHLHHADLAAAPVGLDGTVDVVVANPPYVPLDERHLVDPEVRDHDPGESLWAGEDGLEVIRAVIDRAAQLLRPGGSLVVEHSERHEQSVPAMLAARGFLDVADHRDLAGRPRFCVGVRGSGAA